MPSKSSRARSLRLRKERQQWKRTAANSPPVPTVEPLRIVNYDWERPTARFTTRGSDAENFWNPYYVQSSADVEFFRQTLRRLMDSVHLRQRQAEEALLSPEERQRKEHAMKFL